MHLSIKETNALVTVSRLGSAASEAKTSENFKVGVRFADYTGTVRDIVRLTLRAKSTHEKDNQAD